MFKVDMKGNYFEFPTCFLPTCEYKKIISEINNDYTKYKDQEKAVHYSVDLDGKYSLYYFENHGFNDYNIVEKMYF